MASSWSGTGQTCSTSGRVRPGAAEEVSLEEELRRAIPVVEGLAGAAPVSIDTTKAEVAAAAIDAGAASGQ